VEDAMIDKRAWRGTSGDYWLLTVWC
jgi:hypothetical protein